MLPPSLPPFLVDAWQFGYGEAKPLADPDQKQEQTWYHCQRDVEGLSSWLGQQGLGAGLIDAILVEDSRPRFQVLSNNAFLFIVRGVNLNEGQAPDDMLSLRILFYRNNLYTFRKAPFKAISGVREDLKKGLGPTSLPELLYTLLENIHQRIDDVIDETQIILEELHEIHEDVNHDGQQRLTHLHRRLLKLNRFLKPQSLAISEFCGSQESFFKSRDLIFRGHNQRDVIFRLLENIESLVEQVWMLREHFQQVLAETMNKNTYRLSVIAGVFLPLGFITGLLGVNVGGIPGSDSQYAFEFLCGGLIAVGVIEYLILRKLRFL